MEITGNEPAFAKAAFYHPDGGVDSPQSGMTLRQYYAGLAMQVYIAVGVNDIPEPEKIAEYSIKTADALIKILNVHILKSPSLGENKELV